MDYPLKLMIEGEAANYKISFKVVIPVTTLCPCSKKISQYGAHNQRSLLSVHVELDDIELFDLDEFVSLCEEKSSCQVYGLVKRTDEKFMTEYAYENPKFVEDIMRELIVSLRSLPHVKLKDIECENLESIHHHSAYALHRED
jgi:GTP cyclohydrolase I